MSSESIQKYDLVCAGAGIMSTTLALMCKVLKPDMKIAIFERLDGAAKESSAAWNNAGTGHSAFCELNYTPESGDTVDISKAVKVCLQFEQSRQFWAYLVDQGFTNTPEDFVNPVPHCSWVLGKEKVEFLRKRYAAIKDHVLFQGMEYTEDPAVMKEWFPMIMENRPADHVMAATRMHDGTEVNFGELNLLYARILEERFEGVDIFYKHEVKNIKSNKNAKGEWIAKVKDLKSGTKKAFNATHVFIGSGGGALPLLQTVDIKERKGYGGFPVGGQWLICKNRDLIDKHLAKVYSKAEVGSPPMSTPHLDTRFIDGKRELLFGPFAGFSMKFLKEGSQLDLAKSIKADNIPSMLNVFFDNIPLTQYLIKQVMMSHKDRVNELRKFVVDAKDEDWELMHAGQRVQIIKKNDRGHGVLQFGTEVISNPDGSVTALLGASPGASTAVAVMLEVIEKAFPEFMQNAETKAILDKMIPAWNSEQTTSDLLADNRKYTNEKLKLGRIEA